MEEITILITCLVSLSDMCRSEIFGPFLPILAVGDVDEAMRVLNSKCVRVIASMTTVFR